MNKLISTTAIIAASFILSMNAASAKDDVCSTSKHDYDKKWDNIFKNSLRFQHPSTSTCVGDYDADDASTYNIKVAGALTEEKKNGRLVFDTDGGAGTRSELRGIPLPTNTSTRYTLSAAAALPEAPQKRQYTIGQLFAERPGRSGSRPAVRIEINKNDEPNATTGEVRAVIYPDLNGGSEKYYPSNASKRQVNRFEEIDYEISQKRVNRTTINVVVKIEGETVYDDNIINAEGGNNNYFKLGCYMNNSTIENGCTAKFTSASVSPDIF